MNSTVSSCHIGMHHHGVAADGPTRHTLTVGNVQIALSERSYYCCIRILTFRTVWLLLRNLSLVGAKCVSVMTDLLATVQSGRKQA